MLSQTRDDARTTFYEAFLALLQVPPVRGGGIGRHHPHRPRRQRAARCPTSTCVGPHSRPDSDELITQVIAVENVNAAQLVPVLASA